MNKKILLSLAAAPIILLANNTPKHILNPNSTINHETTPKTIEDLDEFLEKGEFYNRARMNSFSFFWDDEETGKRENHSITGIGGNITYKSAFYEGIGFTAGLWTSWGIGTLENTEANLYKAGKDTLNRYNALNGDNPLLYSFAERYIEFKEGDLSIKLGRQIFEGFLAKSNDSKMIPNTFNGLSIHSKIGNDGKFKFAYFNEQKLRDHLDFHNVLAYEDSPESWSKYLGNDDSAMHKGLTASKLKEKGIDDRLVILEMKNKYSENLMLSTSYTIVPEMVSSAMVQGDYKIPLKNITIKPGIRYMHQFDHGAGKIGGANLNTKMEGYSKTDSLDTSLYGIRVDTTLPQLKTRLGYTKVSDGGDIVAPWRGFPTGGFTRTMGQYNWYANTESFMAQIEYKPAFLENTILKSNYAIQNFDDAKIGVPADSNVFTFDIIKEFKHRSLYLKSRFAHIKGDENTTVTFDNTEYTKPNPGYTELRLEMNYLF